MLLRSNQTRALIFGAIAAFIFFTILLKTNTLGPSHTHQLRDYFAQQPATSQWHSTASRSRWRDLTDAWAGRKDPTKILLASVLYDEPEPNELLERALLTHEKHAERWGYATTVLRKKLADGWWGKWMWLQALVTLELNKDPEDAAEWIMFLSPTAVLNDPTIPLSLFLPPRSITTNLTSSNTQHTIALNDIHFLGACSPSSSAAAATANPDYPAVSTAAFFLRIHPWTATFLQHLLAAPLLLRDEHPNVAADLVVDEDFALAKTLADVAAGVVSVPSSSSSPTNGGGADEDDEEDWVDAAAYAHVVLQPARWYAWSSGGSGGADEDAWWVRAAEHFPAGLGGRRWKELRDAVAAAERGSVDRSYPFGFFSSSSSSSSSSERKNGGGRGAVAAAAADQRNAKPDADVAGAGPAETWRFWEGVAKARAVLREAEEVIVAEESAGRAPGELGGLGDADYAAAARELALAEGVGKIKAAVSFGAGRESVMAEAVGLLKEALYGKGRRVEVDGGVGR